MSDVFPFNCDAKRGHRFIDVHDEFRNEVVLVCSRCGQSLPLRVALARTPTPPHVDMSRTTELDAFFSSTTGTAS